jgi:hypothetical protein
MRNTNGEFTEKNDKRRGEIIEMSREKEEMMSQERFRPCK